MTAQGRPLPPLLCLDSSGMRQTEKQDGRERQEEDKETTTQTQLSSFPRAKSCLCLALQASWHLLSCFAVKSRLRLHPRHIFFPVRFPTRDEFIAGR